jgi:hypothetical protein
MDTGVAVPQTGTAAHVGALIETPTAAAIPWIVASFIKNPINQSSKPSVRTGKRTDTRAPFDTEFTI